jgi:hypothetical protein
LLRLQVQRLLTKKKGSKSTITTIFGSIATLFRC